jgi:hypothetical protein
VFKLLDRFLAVRFRFVEMELGWIPDFLKKDSISSNSYGGKGWEIVNCFN